MWLAMRFLGLLVLAMMGTAMPPAMATRSAELHVPEFAITRPTGEYCEFVVKLSPSAAELEKNRLFDFMTAANAYTKGWRKTFAVVGVNYVTNTTFSLISFGGCSASATTLNFVGQFIEQWQKLHCAGGCGLSQSRIAAAPKLDFAIPYKGFTYKSQIDEFLHYYQRDAFVQCTMEVGLAPAIAAGFPHSALFGAVMDLQKKFRYPIMDISQIDRKLFILLSRQCADKEALYRRMMWNLKRQGVDVDALRSVVFHPDLSDYLFSQTGER
jgi:hypothetical protein